MRLVSAYTGSRFTKVNVLYRLMLERPQNSWISREGVPTLEDHAAFVASKPFLYWYLIQGTVDEGVDDQRYYGAIECTGRNEIGVSIFREFQRRRMASDALALFFSNHNPLPEIPAIRNGNWLANISVHNRESEKFFEKQGFKPLQTTWVKASN